MPHISIPISDDDKHKLSKFKITPAELLHLAIQQYNSEIIYNPVIQSELSDYIRHNINEMAPEEKAEIFYSLTGKDSTKIIQLLFRIGYNKASSIKHILIDKNLIDY